MAREFLGTSSPRRLQWRRLLWSTTRLGLRPLLKGSFARFNSPPTKTPKPTGARGAQPVRTPTVTPTAPQQPRSKDTHELLSGPRVYIPHGLCWQCGMRSKERGHRFNDCTHACLNCAGPGRHAPGGHKTDRCRAPKKGPHNKGFWLNDRPHWYNDAPAPATPHHRQLPLSSGPPVPTPLVVASSLTTQPYCSDLNVF